MKTVATILVIISAPVAASLASDIQTTSRGLSDIDIEKISAVVARVTYAEILSFDLVVPQLDRSDEHSKNRATRRHVYVQVLCSNDGKMDVVVVHESDGRWYLAKEDVIAVQIREAAEEESDADLRQKLWVEYRNYVQSSSPFRSCRKNRPTSNIPLEGDG